MSSLQHLAIIMDGNGRWAQARGHQRIFGHVRGAQIAKRIITESVKRKIPYLTLYAFSTENWSRPKTEVTVLMKILRKYLTLEVQTLMRENIRFRYIGDISRLPSEASASVHSAVEQTSHNTGMTLTFALNYGGRQEIVEATRRLCVQVQSGRLRPEQVDEALLANELQSGFLPDTDLVIRTSGEFRVSNFMLWKAAYAEFLITPTAWPDFDETQLDQALQTYARRERRFGNVGSIPAKKIVGPQQESL